MAQLTKNALYKLSGSDLTYADWLSKEVALYSKKPRKHDFLTWENNRISLQQALSADGDNKTNITDVLKGVLGGVSDTLKAKQEYEIEETQATPEPEKTTILGMPKPVAIGVGVVFFGLVAFGIYKAVKSKK